MNMATTQLPIDGIFDTETGKLVGFDAGSGGGIPLPSASAAHDPASAGADNTGATNSTAAFTSTQVDASNTPLRGYSSVQPTEGAYKVSPRLVPEDYCEEYSGSTDALRVSLDTPP